MRVNTEAQRPDAGKTHGGGSATHQNPEQELRRSVMACMLWEDSFYEDGKSIVDRIKYLVPLVDAEKVAAIAVETRSQMYLRHVPLLVVREMARHPTHRKFVRATLAQVIQRPDELAEFLALYWLVESRPCPRCVDTFGHRRRGYGPACPLCKGTGKISSTGKKEPLAKQVQRGLADAFLKFNAYELAKYNRDNPVKLRDVMFLAHVKPTDGRKGYTRATRKALRELGKNPTPQQIDEHDRTVPPLRDGERLLLQLTENTLPTPDTWEVALSGGADKKAAFTRLLEERKLGGMALIRNLRNMEEARVDDRLIRASLGSMSTKYILPFRFLAAAKAAPRFEPELDAAMLRACQELAKLPGETVFIVDVSGSMYRTGNVSAKSDMTRVHAACALAAIVRENCESADIFATAGNDMTRIHKTERVPARRGMALIDAVHGMCKPLGGGGIFLKQCLDHVWAVRQQRPADRVIVITDEQDCDTNPQNRPTNARQIAKNQYLINVSVERPSIGYGPWVRINGWSEHVLSYIRALETLN